jgi:hypothetical protein
MGVWVYRCIGVRVYGVAIICYYIRIISPAIALGWAALRPPLLRNYPAQATDSFQDLRVLVYRTQVQKVETVSQRKSSNVWIYDTVYTGYTWSPLTCSCSRSVALGIKHCRRRCRSLQ